MTCGDADPLRFSIIVCSWQRPLWLKRCLLSLRQLDYPSFEVVVVADDQSLNQIDANDLKTVSFDEAHLAKARNAGIAVAGGDFCAFIDDDSVAEPMWLYHMAKGLAATGAVAAVGYVRGRNGISFQSRFHSVDREAETHREPDVAGPSIPNIPPERAVKLVGTNMAVSRDVLITIGGFDPMYRYFLEDTDLSIRVSDAGLPVCVIPDAEVHHAYAESPRRTRLRAPKSLYDIGRSTALFLRRHNSGQIDEVYTRVLSRERQRMGRHIANGTCEPRDLKRLLGTFDAGWKEGASADLSTQPEIKKTHKFQSIKFMSSGHYAQYTRYYLNRRKALEAAEREVKAGRRTTLFSFSLTSFRHRVTFTETGVWLHTGGVFGPSERHQPHIRWCRFANRWKDETTRVAIARGLRD